MHACACACARVRVRVCACACACACVEKRKGESGACRRAGGQLPEGGVSLEGCDVAIAGEKLKREHTFSLFTPSRTYFFTANSGACVRA